MKKWLLLSFLLLIPVVYSQEVFLSVDGEDFLLNISGPDFPLAFVAQERYDLKSWGTPDITKTQLRAIGSTWQVESPDGTNEAKGTLMLPEGMYELEITGYINGVGVTVEKINMVLYTPEPEEVVSEGEAGGEGEAGESKTEGGAIQTVQTTDTPPEVGDIERIIAPESSNAVKAKDAISDQLKKVSNPIQDDKRKLWLFVAIAIIIVIVSIIVVFLGIFLQKRKNF